MVFVIFLVLKAFYLAKYLARKKFKARTSMRPTAGPSLVMEMLERTRKRSWSPPAAWTRPRSVSPLYWTPLVYILYI